MPSDDKFRASTSAILKRSAQRLLVATSWCSNGVLGAIAGSIGALGAIALSWAVATFALEMSLSPRPSVAWGVVLRRCLWLGRCGSTWTSCGKAATTPARSNGGSREASC